MADFQGMVITRSGLQLLAKAQTGVTLEISRAAVGSGEWPDGLDPAQRTDLATEEMSLAIQGMEVQSGGVTKLTVLLTNTGLEQGFFIRELGVFANDQQYGEILYTVAYAGDRYDYVPAGIPFEKVFDIYIVTANASSVTAQIDPSVMLALKSDIEDHNADPDAHPAIASRILECSPGVVYGLTLSNPESNPNWGVELSPGVCRDSHDKINMRLEDTLLKRLNSPWTPGNDVNGLAASLTLAANTWYHMFLVRTADGAVDAGFDTSQYATNLVADHGITAIQWVGAVLTGDNMGIIPFFHEGDEFLWRTPPEDVYMELTDEYSTKLITVSVPKGIHTRWLGNAILRIMTDAMAHVEIMSPYHTGRNRSLYLPISGQMHGNGMRFDGLLTNKQGQIACYVGDVGANLGISTLGWRARRGRVW